jgi:hypothetical protein
LVDSWERLIDKEEPANFDFFVVKENLLPEVAIKVAADAESSIVEEESKVEGKEDVIDTSSKP